MTIWHKGTMIKNMPGIGYKKGDPVYATKTPDGWTLQACAEAPCYQHHLSNTQFVAVFEPDGTESGYPEIWLAEHETLEFPYSIAYIFREEPK